MSFPGNIAARPLLYNTAQCEDCLGVWCVFAGVRSVGCISESEWAYRMPILDGQILQHWVLYGTRNTYSIGWVWSVGNKA